MSGNAPVPNGAADAKDPSGFLSEIIGAPVTVKLNSGVVYRGELQSVDGYMNIALEQTKEYVEGKLRRNYGDAFVRGNNGKCLDLEGLNLLLILVVMYISAA
ncbi:U4/U6-U5 snRNP complex subunit lsm6 [Vermiconidia calcicola]|uniref:U4/U6-U5 snRNP complex subunit lsm6 n=1 Tax=Vermiconidia calcicola TaxID=1690605 RepID=A0ACC3N7X9_9PEZI|nr:U4/U6-U5 snRNP complex subunit lsm6 [Vermiconidia calcicola]